MGHNLGNHFQFRIICGSFWWSFLVWESFLRKSGVVQISFCSDTRQKSIYQIILFVFLKNFCIVLVDVMEGYYIDGTSHKSWNGTETLCIIAWWVQFSLLAINMTVFFVSSTLWLAAYWQTCDTIGYTALIYNWLIDCFCSLDHGRFFSSIKKVVNKAVLLIFQAQ